MGSMKKLATPAPRMADAHTMATDSAMDGRSRRRLPQKYSASSQAPTISGIGEIMMASLRRSASAVASASEAGSEMADRPSTLVTAMADRKPSPVISTTMPMVRKTSLKFERKRRFSGSSMRSGSLRALRKASRRLAPSSLIAPASTAARMSVLSNIQCLQDEVAVCVDADFGRDRHRFACDLFGVVFVLIQRSCGGQRIVAP